MRYAELNSKRIVVNKLNSNAPLTAACFVDISDISPEPEIGEFWDGQQFTPPEPAQERVWYTTLDFYRLFNLAKRGEIFGSNDALLMAFLDTLRVSGGCYLDDAETVQGVGYLVTLGLITQAQAESVLSGIAI